MKRLSSIFFFASLFCLTSISVFAQNAAYLDADYKPATAANYTYKRVIKYVKPILNPNIGFGYYGNMTSNVQETGLHVCSLIDYYKTGEPALVVNVLTIDLKCTQWAFDGIAIYYFKNGNLKRKEPYKTGKLHGTVIIYNDDGAEQRREDYQNGKLIEANKFSVSTDNPLVGTWKYQELSIINGKVSKLITVNFSTNGILEITVQDSFINGKSFINTTEKTNWKYIPKSNSSGVLEQYQGDDLLFRGNVKLIGSDQFEYTNTFHPNPDVVGTKFLYTKQ